MFSLDSFYKEYQTEITEVVVNGRKFNILLPKFLAEFINSHDIFHEFPLWAKIWHAHGFWQTISPECRWNRKSSSWSSVPGSGW